MGRNYTKVAIEGNLLSRVPGRIVQKNTFPFAFPLLHVFPRSWAGRRNLVEEGLHEIEHGRFICAAPCSGCTVERGRLRLLPFLFLSRSLSVLRFLYFPSCIKQRVDTAEELERDRHPSLG